jgi:hypothetical protein
MNHSDFNKQNTVVWTQADSKSKDSVDRPQSDNANIIPFPARPAPGKQPATRTTGARFIRLSIRKVLRRTRERVLSHIRMTNKPDDGQRNGACNGSATVRLRARA